MNTITIKYIPFFYLTVNRTAADEQEYYCVLALQTGHLRVQLSVANLEFCMSMVAFLLSQRGWIRVHIYNTRLIDLRKIIRLRKT